MGPLYHHLLCFALCPALGFCSLSCSAFLFSVLLYVLCPVFCCCCSQFCSVFSVLCFCSLSWSVFSVQLCVFVFCAALFFSSLSCSVFLFSVLLSVLFSVLLCVFVLCSVLCPALCSVLCPALCFVLCSVPPPTPYLVFSCTLFFVALSALPCHAGHPKEIRAMRTNKSFFPFLI